MMDFEVTPERVYPKSDHVSVELLESVKLSSVDGTYRLLLILFFFTNIVFTNFVSTNIVSMCTKANFTATVYTLSLTKTYIFSKAVK